MRAEENEVSVSVEKYIVRIKSRNINSDIIYTMLQNNALVVSALCSIVRLLIPNNAPSVATIFIDQWRAPQIVQEHCMTGQSFHGIH